MLSDVRTEAELIAAELHDLLQAMDPAQARRELSQRFRDHAEVLRTRIESLLAEMKEEPHVSRLGESLRNLAAHLDEVCRSFAWDEPLRHGGCCTRRSGARRDRGQTEGLWKRAFLASQPT